MKTIKRLASFVWRNYSIRLVVVVLCIIFSAVSSTVASVFLQRLIDEVIVPGVENGLASVASA